MVVSSRYTEAQMGSAGKLSEADRFELYHKHRREQEEQKEWWANKKIKKMVGQSY